MEKVYRSVRGTTDFFPAAAARFNAIAARSREVFRRFAYEEIILPVLEEEELFVRTTGSTSDIVEKQLFRIADKEGICLRPEGTAQVVRYFLENSLFKQGDFYKFFYIGPMFRGERPQRGRLRQFHHIGCEALGADSPQLDAETVLLATQLLEENGLKEYAVKINSLGCLEDKNRFADKLREVLAGRRSALCEDCQRRLDKNPLRVLDCKNPPCRQVVVESGITEETLCEKCQDAFSRTLKLLDTAGVKYVVDKMLVRGLDYYTNTVFEITSQALGAQDAVGAGGRYNNLVSGLGGPATAAVGFAIGVERLTLALGEPPAAAGLDVFVAAFPGLREKAFDIVRDLRNVGLAVDMDYCEKSFKSQLRTAQRKNARRVIIVGEDELKENCVMLKNMADSRQEKISLDGLAEKVKNNLTV